ncbi:MAG: phosphoribosylglycinamide formyltransferase [Phycisphaera sp.]|nr:phosphoribosylglycinamide formyltransferase [Phycisphaera sp.]
MHRHARLGILISGSGRSALNIADACEHGRLDATVALVVAHREEVEGVARCRARGLRVAVVPTGPNLEDRLDACLEAASVELVCLAGYLRRFRVGERWRNRALNIHPSLLPKFGGAGMYGLRVHAAVLAAGERETGCTVHFADEEYDRGAAVTVRRCAVETGDTPEALAARVFREECIAYPEAIAAVLSRRTRGTEARVEALR